MPQYKLTYFDFRGLGEPIRCLLAYLNEEFEDHRITFEQWPTLKSTTPSGKVPVLEVDGNPLCQSVSICRWLGKKANLAGTNDWESLQIDIAIDTFTDLRLAVAESWFEKDPEKKAKILAALVADTVPAYMSKFDKLIQENGGFLANGSLSWADIYFASVMESFMHMINDKELMEKYFNVKALKEKVENIPQVKAWIAKRPVTVM